MKNTTIFLLAASLFFASYFGYLYYDSRQQVDRLVREREEWIRLRKDVDESLFKAIKDKRKGANLTDKALFESIIEGKDIVIKNLKEAKKQVYASIEENKGFLIYYNKGSKAYIVWASVFAGLSVLLLSIMLFQIGKKRRKPHTKSITPRL